MAFLPPSHEHLSPVVQKDPLHCVEGREKAETWLLSPMAVSALTPSLGLSFPKCSVRDIWGRETSESPFYLQAHNVFILEQLALETTATHALGWPIRAQSAAPSP